MKTNLTNQSRTGSVLITLALLLTSWPLHAQPSRMEQGQITSAALATNLFGDPALRAYRVSGSTEPTQRVFLPRGRPAALGAELRVSAKGR